jgi:hypothetical protein
MSYPYIVKTGESLFNIEEVCSALEALSASFKLKHKISLEDALHIFGLRKNFRIM